MPMERLLVETDAPYMAPVPVRGKRNEPAYVRFVAEKVAELRGMTLDEVERRRPRMRSSYTAYKRETYMKQKSGE